MGWGWSLEREGGVEGDSVGLDNIAALGDGLGDDETGALVVGASTGC